MSSGIVIFRYNPARPAFLGWHSLGWRGGVPEGMANNSAITVGAYPVAALRSDGIVAAWGAGKAILCSSRMAAWLGFPAPGP